MRRYTLVLALAGLSVAALASIACSGETTTVNNPPNDTSGIVVTGRGEVQAPPDTGFFDVGVQSTAPQLGDARDRAAKAADAVISSLKSNRIDDKDIKTTGFAIQPQYDYSRGGSEPRITGYVVTNTVQAKVRKLETFSKIIDDAVAAGGNDVRVQGIRFGIEDDEKLLQQAREQAMANAKAKAEQLAKLGGVGLGKPLAIGESQPGTPIPEAFAAARDLAQSGAPSTPIQTGTNTVVVEVSVRWAIK